MIKVQAICSNGHYYEYDITDTFDASLKRTCNICNQYSKWVNTYRKSDIDYGIIPIKVLDKYFLRNEQETTIDSLGNIHITREKTYHTPLVKHTVYLSHYYNKNNELIPIYQDLFNLVEKELGILYVI